MRACECCVSEYVCECVHVSVFARECVRVSECARVRECASGCVCVCV